jgi:hypothetical protein
MPLQLAPLLNRQRDETRRAENQRATTRTEVAARQPHTRAARGAPQVSLYPRLSLSRFLTNT